MRLHETKGPRGPEASSAHVWFKKKSSQTEEVVSRLSMGGREGAKEGQRRSSVSPHSGRGMGRPPGRWRGAQKSGKVGECKGCRRRVAAPEVEEEAEEKEEAAFQPSHICYAFVPESAGKIAGSVLVVAEDEKTRRLNKKTCVAHAPRLIGCVLGIIHPHPPTPGWVGVSGEGQGGAVLPTLRKEVRWGGGGHLGAAAGGETSCVPVFPLLRRRLPRLWPTDNTRVQLMVQQLWPFVAHYLIWPDELHTIIIDQKSVIKKLHFIHFLVFFESFQYKAKHCAAFNDTLCCHFTLDFS